MFATVAMMVGAATAQTVNVPILHFPPEERSGTYLDVQIGTPAQTVSVIFDTGSATLAVGSSSTTGSHTICPADQPLPASMDNWATENLNDESGVCAVGSYNPAASSTEVAGAGGDGCNTPIAGGKCGFAVAYGTGAYGIDGYLVRDDLRMGGRSAKVSIGAITSMVGGWQQPPANGIFGVAMSSLNCLPASMSSSGGAQTCEQNAMTTFLSSSGLPDKFALCLGNAAKPGVLTLGGSDSSFYTGSMHYTPITNSEGFYAVGFTALGLNGRQLCDDCVVGSGPEAGPTIVDSGTPSLLLPTEAYQQLTSTSDSCTTDNDCLVTMQIGDVCVNSAGLMSCESGTCTVIPGAVTTAANVNGGSAIIGNAAINRMYVEFDRSGSRVGFAERSGSCSVPCSSYLSVHSCQRAQCTWSGTTCSGGTGVGNSAGGTRVTSGGTCFTSTASAPAPASGGDSYGSDYSAPVSAPAAPVSAPSDSYGDGDDYSAPVSAPVSAPSDSYSDGDDYSAPVSAPASAPSDSYGDDGSAPASAPVSQPSSGSDDGSYGSYGGDSYDNRDMEAVVANAAASPSASGNSSPSSSASTPLIGALAAVGVVVIVAAYAMHAKRTEAKALPRTAAVGTLAPIDEAAELLLADA